MQSELDVSGVRAIDQEGADAAFLALDGLADAGLREVQPLGGAAEVQFLGQGQGRYMRTWSALAVLPCEVVVA